MQGGLQGPELKSSTPVEAGKILNCRMRSDPQRSSGPFPLPQGKISDNEAIPD